MKKIAVLLFGPHSCAKGTECSGLRKSGFDVFGSGEFFRTFMTKQPEHPHTQEITDTLKRGDYVRDDIVFEIIDPALVCYLDSPRLVIDGIPRTTNQFVHYTTLLRLGGYHIVGIFFDVPILECITRERGRQRGDVVVVEHRMQNYLVYTAAMIGMAWRELPLFGGSFTLVPAGLQWEARTAFVHEQLDRAAGELGVKLRPVPHTPVSQEAEAFIV